MYIRLPNSYPFLPTQLRQEYPNTSFPREMRDETLAEYGVFPVTPVPEPSYDSDAESLEEAPPALVEGVWTQQWTVRTLTAEELQARIPQAVTALQGMLAIQAAGLTTDFLAWKNALDPVADFAVLAFLERAQTWRYDDPILSAALVALGIESQKNALFTLAATL